MPISNFSCSSCLSGKQSRKSIPKCKSSKTTHTLQLIHYDVVGPFRVRSLGGAHFFLTFTDDFSKKTYVYFLSSKAQVLEKFKLFHQEVERLSKNKIGILRTDNGSEYTSRDFSSYSASVGILRQFSQPYTPQNNGVAERENHNIFDIVKCFLAKRDVPSSLWAEAVRAAYILLNLCSSKRHLDKILDELFSSHKPNISHLHTFGSLVFVHQTKLGSSKLAPCATPHLHLSFDHQTKGYRCYDPITNKIIISKDLCFFKNAFNTPNSYSSLLYNTPVSSSSKSILHFSVQLPLIPSLAPI